MKNQKNNPQEKELSQDDDPFYYKHCDPESKSSLSPDEHVKQLKSKLKKESKEDLESLAKKLNVPIDDLLRKLIQ